jgi:hypothetical protein
MTHISDDAMSPDDPHLLAVVSSFGSLVSDVIAEKLGSIVLHGSLSLGDFRPGRGDLDFVAILRCSLSQAECESLFRLHDALRQGSLGDLGRQLEGACCPVSFLQGAADASGRGCYIGTRRDGWKELERSCVSALDRAIIVQHGVVVFGTDCRSELQCPSRQDVLCDVCASLQSAVATCADARQIGFAMEVFSMVPRALHFVRTNEFIGKTSACARYLESSPRSRWAGQVAAALAERRIGKPDEQVRFQPGLVSEAAAFAADAARVVCPRTGAPAEGSALP